MWQVHSAYMISELGTAFCKTPADPGNTAAHMQRSSGRARLQRCDVAQVWQQGLCEQVVPGRACAVRRGEPRHKLEQQHAHRVRIRRLAQLPCV